MNPQYYFGRNAEHRLDHHTLAGTRQRRLDASASTFRLKNIEIDHMTTGSRIFHSKVKHMEQQRKRPSFCLFSSTFSWSDLFNDRRGFVCGGGGTRRSHHASESSFVLEETRFRRLQAEAEVPDAADVSTFCSPGLLRRLSSHSKRCVKFSGKSPFWAPAPRANQSLSLMPVSQPASCNNNNVNAVLPFHR